MALKKKQRAAARADHAPAIGHVRQALMNVFSRHAGEICPTDYMLAEDFIYHYASAHSRPDADPRDHVYMGAWSSHRRHRPGCDCRSRMHRSARSGKWNERCLRHVKRRRNQLVDRGLFVIRIRSEKGGMLKAKGKRKARGNSHTWWVGPEVEAEIYRLEKLNRGAAPLPPPLPVKAIDDSDVDAPAAAPRPHFPSLTKFLSPSGARVAHWQHTAPAVDAGARTLHGPGCTCEHCFAQLQLPTGHDPPGKA